MKKFIIISVSIFLLLLSFTFGVFVKKHIDDKTFDSFLLSQMSLKKENKKYTQDNVNYREALKRNNILKSDNWEKVTDDIYIDKRYITYDLDSDLDLNSNLPFGWFITFNSEKHDLGDVDGIPVYYYLTKYAAYCTPDAELNIESGALCFAYLKKFDKNGNILFEGANQYEICPSPTAWNEGEEIYKTLCTYRKKRE